MGVPRRPLAVPARVPSASSCHRPCVDPSGSRSRRRPHRVGHAVRGVAGGDGVTVNRLTTDVAIEMARDKDGSVVVLPALAV